MKILIAGCGDLGLKLAGRLIKAGHQVFGLRRKPCQGPYGLIWINADLKQPDTLVELPANLDGVIYMATPDEHTESGYRSLYVSGLGHLLEAIGQSFQGRLVYVSSTAVYGQRDGSWVDESSATEPRRFNGRVMLDGEQHAALWSADLAIARLGGIYGPGRNYLLRKACETSLQIQARPPVWTNRIHIDDAAGVLELLLDRQNPAGVYNVVDEQPAPRHEVLGWLATELGQAAPELLDADNESDQGKRVAGEKIKAVGFELRYPNYKVGYLKNIEDFEK